ncbi:MAG: baseplate J/gp47 family protein [Chloroflexota bacterium]|jgi:hypothetical protein
MAVWYLDNDDEITDAVARLRGTEDELVVFVVPPGSRIATGRINFKLLAREAETRELSMAIASPDEQVRAMATSAGVLARQTPDEAQAAIERGDEPDSSVLPAPGEPVAAAVGGPGEQPSALLTWRSQRTRVATLVVLAIAIAGWLLASQVLPTAEITLAPRIVGLGPITATITASADVTTADAQAGTVPATALRIPLFAEDTYQASGTTVSETRARGEVVFSAADQDFDQEIAAGTRVRTPAGIEFQTTETVVLPRGSGSVSRVLAPIEAVVAGPDGNRPAEAISIVPSLESQGIEVSNPQPTSGGRREEQPTVTAADYDAAAVDLRNRLSGALAAYLRDPANQPAELTVFAETAVLGPLTLEPSAAEIVGSSASGFDLGGSVSAQVLAVDETAVDTLTGTILQASVPEGMRLLPGSARVERDEGDAEGDLIAFETRASGSITPVIDPEALVAEVSGLPVSEAQAILDELGTATVNVWPGFLGDLPNDRERISLDVLEASATE